MVLDELRETDEALHVNGLHFVYNKHEKGLFDQTFIDYKDFWYGKGFVICSPASEPCYEND